MNIKELHSIRELLDLDESKTMLNTHGEKWQEPVLASLLDARITTESDEEEKTQVLKSIESCCSGYIIFRLFWNKKAASDVDLKRLTKRVKTLKNDYERTVKRPYGGALDISFDRLITDLESEQVVINRGNQPEPDKYDFIQNLSHIFKGFTGLEPTAFSDEIKDGPFVSLVRNVFKAIDATSILGELKLSESSDGNDRKTLRTTVYKALIRQHNESQEMSRQGLEDHKNGNF
jgi:hypothetical protein